MISNSSENLTCGRWNTTIHGKLLKPYCTCLNLTHTVHIGWSTRNCHISNFTDIDGKQSSIMEPIENDTTSEMNLEVYETKFYQPGYFGLILVIGELIKSMTGI